MKVKYVGWDGYGNFGDDETKNIIKALGFEFDDSADTLMIGAGTLLPLNYKMREKIGDKKFKKIICFGTGVSDNRENNKTYDVDMAYTRNFLKNADFVGIRSQKERELLGMGEVIGDPLFLTKYTGENKKRKDFVILNVGTSIGNGYGGVKGELNAFFEMLDFVKEEIIEKQGKKVIVLPIWSMDFSFSFLAAKYLGTEGFDKIPNLYEMYEILSKTEYVIGYKLHMLISCLTMNVPVMQVEYGKKTRFMASDFYIEDNLVRTDGINREKLINAYKAMKKWNHEEIEVKKNLFKERQFKFLNKIMESETE